MKNFFTKKTNSLTKYLLVIIFAVSANITNGQNKYLSFENGIQKLKSQTTLPSRVYKNTHKGTISLDYKFNGAIVSTKKVDKLNYQFLHIKGFQQMGQIGAPALPSHKEIVALPEGATGKIVITNVKYKEYKGYNIHPTLQPASDVEGSPEPKFEKDLKVYTTNSFFPERIAEIINIGMNRNIPLNFIEIRPVQFNPVTGIIRVYTDIQFNIEYDKSKTFASIANTNSKHFTDLLKRKIINSDDIPNGITKSTKSDSKNYIIITNSEYQEQANTLANWKRQLGYSVEVVSQPTWTSPEVKEAIKSRYDAWTPKPDYFVIIGDHTGTYAVPGEIHQESQNNDDFATDLYYACMDGSSDWHPDMAYGRISVQNQYKANVVINKIIKYEQNPPTDASFYQNTLNCAMYQDDDNNGYADRRFLHTSEDIRNYLQTEEGYTTSKIYYTETTADKTTLKYNNDYYSNGELLPAELRTTSFNWNGNATNIKNEINAGKFIVFHRDHGYTGGVGWAHPEFLTSTISGLSNGDNQPVVFSMNCHTGEYQLNNCFAEEFLRSENKGAVGVFAAAYYSLSGYNDALSIGMIDAIWSTPGLYPVMGSAGSGTNYTIGAGNDIHTMGDVLLQGLYAMEQNVSWTGSRKYEYELFHYFGDPTMKMWTSNPNDDVISATHPSSIDCSSNSITISNSEPNAIATLVCANTLIGKVVLDASGNGVLNYTLTAPDSAAFLTISKTNAKPYIATLPIEGDCAFPPIVNTLESSNISQTECTFSGEITNAYGSAIIANGFVFSTTPNPFLDSANVENITATTLDSTGTFSTSATNLTSSTTYYYKAYAINGVGISYGEQKTFNTLCGEIATFPYTQDFSTGELPSCWEDNDNQGSGQIWEFNNPGGRTLSSTTSANGFAILDSDNYGSGGEQDADLISPTINFTGYDSVQISFEHYFKAYTGSSAKFSYSIDNGNTWNDIETWTSSTSNAATFSQDLSSQLAGQSSVKLKWNYVGSYGYYWAIDDINISVVQGTTYPVTFKVLSTEDSHPINNATINIFNTDLTTSTDGNATIELSNGTYNYTISAQDYTNITGSITVNNAEVNDTVLMSLATYTISFDVKNNITNEPISGAVVTLDGYGNVTSNDIGNATFTDVYGTSSIDWSISATGYEPQSETIEIHSNISKTIKLIGNDSITFHVQDSDDGHSVDNANVTLGDYGMLTTNSFGNVVFKQLGTTDNIEYSIIKPGYNVAVGNTSIGQIDTLVVSISKSTPITFNTSTSPTTCFGDANGQITISNVQGGTNNGYKYSINSGETYQTSPEFNNLAAQTYNVVVKDSIATTSEIKQVEVEQPDSISFTTNITDVSIYGGNDGIIEITNVQGGSNSGYKYSLNSGTTWKTTNIFNNLIAHVYHLRMKDGNDCQTPVYNVEVSQPDLVLYTITFIVKGDNHVLDSALVTINGTQKYTNSDGEAKFELQTGTYNYKITKDGFGNIDGSVIVENESKNVTISMVGIMSAKSLGINIYPNPTKGVLHLEGNNHFNVMVFNSIGNKISETEINQTGTIDLSKNAKGLYFVKIQSIDKTVTVPIVVK